jgi:hypothetical protein
MPLICIFVMHNCYDFLFIFIIFENFIKKGIRVTSNPSNNNKCPHKNHRQKGRKFTNLHQKEFTKMQGIYLLEIGLQT